MIERIRRTAVRGAKTDRLRSARQFPWTTEEDALLGKFDDRELETRLKRTAASIKARRHQLGIPALHGKPQPWKAGVAALLAQKSDKQLRALLGWSIRRIRDERRRAARRRDRKPRL
jgi:hypothetical protein